MYIYIRVYYACIADTYLHAFYFKSIDLSISLFIYLYIYIYIYPSI